MIEQENAVYYYLYFFTVGLLYVTVKLCEKYCAVDYRKEINPPKKLPKKLYTTLPLRKVIYKKDLEALKKEHSQYKNIINGIRDILLAEEYVEPDKLIYNGNDWGITKLKQRAKDLGMENLSHYRHSSRKALGQSMRAMEQNHLIAVHLGIEIPTYMEESVYSDASSRTSSSDVYWSESESEIFPYEDK